MNMKKINVLMVGNSPSVKGGITSVISQILEHDWCQEGIEMNFIPTYIEENNISKILFFINAYYRIKHEIKHNKPDVVHIHMSYRGSFTRKYLIHKLCRKNGIPDIIHLHGSEFEKWYNEVDKKKKEKIKKMMRECNSFIVLGNKWNQVIKKIEPLTNTVVISNTVKIPDEMTKWNSSPFQILFLGVLIKRKGVGDLLEAVANLIYEKSVDNVKLVIAGTGVEEQNLKCLAAELKIEKYVDFAGWTNGEKKQELLLKSQLLILPSYNEGLPMAILEAMSYGLPVISTDVGDIASAVYDGENGYLVAPGDVNCLSDRIYHIIVNENLYNEFSIASKRKVVSEFSDTEYFKTIKRCYNKTRN